MAELPAERRAAIEARTAELVAEIELLREDCAEAYQVVGHLASLAGVFEAEGVEKVLDNLHAASAGEPRPHEDALPLKLETRSE